MAVDRSVGRLAGISYLHVPVERSRVGSLIPRRRQARHITAGGQATG
jgi:hypothetical protein